MRRFMAVALVVGVVPTVGAAGSRVLLTAEYSPGLSANCAWKAEIDGAGQVTRYVEPSLATGKCDTFAWPRPALRRVAGHSQLSAAELDNLKRAVAVSDLGSVPFHAVPGMDCQGNPYVVADEDELSIQLAV